MKGNQNKEVATKESQASSEIARWRSRVFRASSETFASKHGVPTTPYRRMRETAFVVAPGVDWQWVVTSQFWDIRHDTFSVWGLQASGISGGRLGQTRGSCVAGVPGDSQGYVGFPGITSGPMLECLCRSVIFVYGGKMV